MEIDYQLAFKELLKHHVEAGYLRDENVRRVMGGIPIDVLISEPQLRRFVLEDSPAVFYYEDERNARTISAPHMISMMSTMLQLNTSDRVLILGSKGGLIEAVIAGIAKDVYIVEEHDTVASITEEAFIKLGLTNIWVQRRNPLMGIEEEAPFTKILITGATPILPKCLLDQLTVHGIIVFPMMLTKTSQVILQLFKLNRKNKFEIVNFGSVLFQSLYFNEISELNRKDDFFISKLQSMEYKEMVSNLFKEMAFFEEFRRLPNLIIREVQFTENQKINHVISNNLVSDSGDHPGEIQLNLAAIIINPDNLNFLISFEVFVEETDHLDTIKNFTIHPNLDNVLHFSVKIPLIEGRRTVHLSCIGPKRYRVSKKRLFIHLTQSDEEWAFLLELEGHPGTTT